MSDAPISAEQMEWFREHWALADKHKVIASHEALRAQVDEALAREMFAVQDRLAAKRRIEELESALTVLVEAWEADRHVPYNEQVGIDAEIDAARAVLAAVPDPTEEG